MVGITLSPEQIGQAPPEVRRWLEQQVAATLGFHHPAPSPGVPERHLVACDVAQAQAVLSRIQGMLPVVSVFFELGLEPVATSPEGVRALRLDEMTRHARLQTPRQVVACLNAIDEALQNATGRSDAALTAIDDAGHCLVADVTARSILAVWQEIVAARGLAHPGEAQASPGVPREPAMAGQAPYSLSMPTFTTPG
ncbi:MAG TPA: hypothetical protein DDZ81_06715 [Acetobacteraceae bacterium]|nr:hypothetical protein [Acetobacteraceae bacterium]